MAILNRVSRGAHARAMLERLNAGKKPHNPRRSVRGGKREDLGGMYLRSQSEANYARYLNLLVAQGRIRSWQYEPRTFVFEAIRRGIRDYTPDFRVELTDGRHEWHEVKGWMDKPSKTRLRRMAQYFPNEVVRVIDGKWFAAARKSGLAASIPHWEARDGRGH